jgi:hypothetical protein
MQQREARRTDEQQANRATAVCSAVRERACPVSASPETDRGRKGEVELERARDSINRALAIIPPSPSPLARSVARPLFLLWSAMPMRRGGRFLGRD